jgi:hypothetical protein
MKGDSIVECDGEPVTCPLALLHLLEQDVERRPVELTVLRRVKGSGDSPAETDDDTRSAL